MGSRGGESYSPGCPGHPALHPCSGHSGHQRQTRITQAEHLSIPLVLLKTHVVTPGYLKCVASWNGLETGGAGHTLLPGVRAGNPFKEFSRSLALLEQTAGGGCGWVGLVLFFLCSHREGEEARSFLQS